ncbi:MAG TPA: M23 family metallopeptidase [Polyangiaceae bacterium]
MDGPEPKTPADAAAPQEQGGESAGASDPVESTGETPQTASIAPTPASSEGGRRARKGLDLPPRLRAALAVAGGAVVIGAIVAPLTLGAGASGPIAQASAAPRAGAASGAGAIADDGGVDAGPDVVEDTAPARPSVWRVARLADDAGITLVEGVLGRRPLLVALGSAGVSRSESQRIARSLGDVRDVDRFGPRDTFTVARDKASGHVVAYEMASSPIDVWQAREEPQADGSIRLMPRRLDLQSERVRVRKAVLVGADLRASFADAGLGPIDDVLAMLDDALEGHAELPDLRPGARLRVLATQERVDGVFTRWTSLDAVEYFPAAPSAPSVRVYWFGDDERPKDHHGWYDARGRQPNHGGWRTPLPFARIASRFNPHRMHPVLHVVMPHNGVDFAAGVGAPVYSTAAGVVTAVGMEGPCGNRVEIAHAGGISSVYCHLSRFAAGLHVGQHVESRQLIAYVGQTGRVTGPHLHFGIKRGGVFIDPMTLRLDGVRVVPRGKRDEFDRLRAELDAELDAIPLPAPGQGPQAGAPGQGLGQAPGESRPPEAEPETDTFYEEPP